MNYDSSYPVITARKQIHSPTTISPLTALALPMVYILIGTQKPSARLATLNRGPPLQYLSRARKYTALP